MICRNILLTAGLVLVCALAVRAGCPFDDGSCQAYCNQQGCNLGYCGHFAWIQCICRKCGDEWNWYDKVHYNPDKQVNQTELDSLKLNVSGPIILTNNNVARTGASGQQQQVAVAPSPSVESKQQEQKAVPVNKEAATLTTLLIPDLSDGSKLDLNDIPDENSEKFLDYLAKNHEKLAQATNGAQGAKTPAATSSDDENDNNDDGEPVAEETVEIQISSSDNQRQQQQQQHAQAQAQQAQPHQQPASRQQNPTPDDDEDDDNEEQRQQAAGSQVTRLLKMAVAERASDDIF